MEIGVGLPAMVPGTSPTQMLTWARRAEERGFSTLAVLDRLVYDSWESLVTLAAAAAVTERIRLATTILIAAYRANATLLAKQLATVDRLSSGRLVVGVAAGGRADDFTASGVSYVQRGRRLDELLAEMIRIWAEDDSIGPCHRRGGPPVLVGGHSPAALARAARYGQGWIAGGSSAVPYPELVRRLQRSWSTHGRRDRPRLVALAYFALGPDAQTHAERYLRAYYAFSGPYAERVVSNALSDEHRLRDTLAGYAEAGCDELILFPCTCDPEQVDLLAGTVL